MMEKESIVPTSEIVRLHDLYFKPYISEIDIRNKINEIGKELSERFKGKCPLFINVLNGSFVFAADLLRACDINCEVSFIKIASYEGLSSSGKTQTIIGLTEEVKGRDIIILEDIVDSGRTLYRFLQQLKEQEPASITVVALLVKPDAAEFKVKLDYVGFEIPNAFVVGYGLDYNGLGRNLKGVYQLTEEMSS